MQIAKAILLAHYTAKYELLTQEMTTVCQYFFLVSQQESNLKKKNYRAYTLQMQHFN